VKAALPEPAYEGGKKIAPPQAPTRAPTSGGGGGKKAQGSDVVMEFLSSAYAKTTSKKPRQATKNRKPTWN
jgi:hypothetical protein